MSGIHSADNRRPPLAGSCGGDIQEKHWHGDGNAGTFTGRWRFSLAARESSIDDIVRDDGGDESPRMSGRLGGTGSWTAARSKSSKQRHGKLPHSHSKHVQQDKLSCAEPGRGFKRVGRPRRRTKSSPEVDDERPRKAGGGSVPDLLRPNRIPRQQALEDRTLLHEEGVRRLHFRGKTARHERHLPVLQDGPTS